MSDCHRAIINERSLMGDHQRAIINERSLMSDHQRAIINEHLIILALTASHPVVINDCLPVLISCLPAESINNQRNIRCHLNKYSICVQPGASMAPTRVHEITVFISDYASK
ncbi:hypothetical protein EJ02DRAFT_490257 [Clathrospora elynae]|uniref:Uncharacterized protein n=1 Tax=Clathrospora elynae TaxID=706981 RepID=A0A6A5SR63_9PLEO|nr:hypothetical protein EJ02DRAFT_490257 [Clathrospora elynae]